MLAQKWQFPASLVECIRNHHQAPPLQGLGRSLFLANQIVKSRAFGDSGNPEIAALPAGLVGQLGKDYESIAQKFPGLEGNLEQARGYAGVRAEL
jgi:HD-like signal output (HDOD) protein